MAIRHFLKDNDITPAEQDTILRAATVLSTNPHAAAEALYRKTIALYFEKPSLRTRISCQLAAHNLGAYPLPLRGEELQLRRGESAEDTARVLEGYLDLFLGRVKSHSLLEKFAATNRLPIVNGLSDVFHPLQSLADLLTIMQEWPGKLRGKHIVFLGDGNNVCRSLAMASAMAGVNFTVAAPSRYQLRGEWVETIQCLSDANGARFSQTSSPKEAVSQADVLYTDVWASMGDEAEVSDRLATFAAYQLNHKLLKEARPEAIVLHCLPAHKEEEISAEVLEGQQSRVFQQAHNRLPATAAVFLFLLDPQTCAALAASANPANHH
jgi:ornithine carbamoyltransferase